MTRWTREDLERGYWLRLVWNQTKFYLWRRRQPIAWLRALGGILLGDNVERCQECGRRYVMWRSTDVLYVQVHGSAFGGVCPWHFDEEAQHRGLALLWVPHVFTGWDDEPEEL